MKTGDWLRSLITVSDPPTELELSLLRQLESDPPTETTETTEIRITGLPPNEAERLISLIEAMQGVDSLTATPPPSSVVSKATQEHPRQSPPSPHGKL